MLISLGGKYEVPSASNALIIPSSPNAANWPVVCSTPSIKICAIAMVALNSLSNGTVS